MPVEFRLEGPGEERRGGHEELMSEKHVDKTVEKPDLALKALLAEYRLRDQGRL